MATTREPPDVLTMHEAAEFLRVSARTLWDMVQDGQIPSFRVGRQHRFSRKVLTDWMQSQSTGKESA
jgi:excisionase family DNA binding protein